MIEQREIHRRNGDYINEKMMSKAIKAQVRIDRRQWLDEMLETGNWTAIKRYKKAQLKPQMSIQSFQNSRLKIITRSIRKKNVANGKSQVPTEMLYVQAIIAMQVM